MHEKINIDDIKVSAIINTYNRYTSLINAINSVRQQTHSNIELIVINDKSESKEYHRKAHEHDNLRWVDLEISSREKFGFPCLGYTRNIGISYAQGEYIAFLDDDDLWMPQKTEIQLSAMVKNGWEMSSTEAYMGDSYYDKNKEYPVYHAEFYEDFCKPFFIEHYGQWNQMLPEVFDLKLIQQHNFIIHSSVMLKKSLFNKIDLYKELPLNGIMINGKYVSEDREDWELWRRMLEHTNCLHINQPLVYYDGRLSNRKLHRKLLKKVKQIFQILKKRV